MFAIESPNLLNPTSIAVLKCLTSPKLFHKRGNDGSQMSDPDLIDIFRSDAADRLSDALSTIPVDFVLPSEWDGHLGMLSYSPPLISIAAFFAAEHCFNALVAQDADLYALDFFRTPLSHFAAAGGCVTILIALLERGMPFAGAGFPAIEHRQLNAVKWMLQNRLIRYEDVDSRGYSHLLVAVETGCFEIVQEFVNRYQLFASARAGYSAVSLCLAQDSMETARFLIGQSSIDLNQADIDGVCLDFPIHHCTLHALRETREL
jgi:hypothetical protein